MLVCNHNEEKGADDKSKSSGSAGLTSFVAEHSPSLGKPYMAASFNSAVFGNIKIVRKCKAKGV
jgi:hypothetical protein